MTAHCHAEDRLGVSRSELAQALKIVARVMGEYSGRVEVTFEDEQLLDLYSEPCALVAAELGLKPERPQIDEQQIINDAMMLLKPLHIKRSDLEALVSDVQARGPASWLPEDRQFISVVAKAAPDLRRLVEVTVRNALK